jgi:hypothetical protein
LEKRWWTTGRQVSVADTLLELAACGVIDFATIDPDGCIEIPSLQFEDVQLDLPDTDADMTDTGFPSSPFPLHIPEVTTTSKLVVSLPRGNPPLAVSVCLHMSACVSVTGTSFYTFYSIIDTTPIKNKNLK